MRSQMIKVRSIMEGQGRGLMFDFDFHDVPQGWWGPRKWPKLRAKLFAHDPWLVEMLEHHQRLLIAQQGRIAELEREIARESQGWGPDAQTGYDVVLSAKSVAAKAEGAKADANAAAHSSAPTT